MPPKLIGITGGIGSGKSLIGRVLEVLDFFVYNADNAAKSIVYQSEVKSKIIDLLGPDAYDKNDNYNKPYIAEKVFENKELLNKLNQIIHPAVKNDFKNWIQTHSKEKILFKEAAILFETGTYQSLDATILVTAPKELKISRVLERDQTSREEILKRMDNQWTDLEKMKYADYIVKNDESELIIDQIYQILDDL